MIEDTRVPARRLVLASASPRRRQLLASIGLPAEVRPVDLDETALPNEPADAYVRRLAEAKARARAHAGEVVLAADTVVAADGLLLGKPADAEDAAAMLRRLSGRQHQVLTGLAVFTPDDGVCSSHVEISAVRFSALEDAEIAAYVASGEPMDKAGAYAIQGLAALFIDRMEGVYSNVVGLPLNATYQLLRRVGYAVVTART